MDYGKIIRRAADIVWEHKFLMLLGFLAGLGSGTFNSSLNFGGNDGGFDPGQVPGWREFPFQGPFPGGFEGGPRIGAALFLLLCLGLLVALIIFVVANVARGGLIAAVDQIETGERPGLGEAWAAGWSRLWTLLGIGLVPAIPYLLLLLLSLLGFLGMVGLRSVNVSPGSVVGVPYGGFVAALTCLLVPIALILGLLRTFANRAAMLEGTGALAAYRRGFSVLMENLGEAFLLFLLQIAISIGLFILLVVPGIIAVLCCILWPVLILFQGAVTAYFSTLWTLAWRRWTGRMKQVDMVKSTV